MPVCTVIGWSTIPARIDNLKNKLSLPILGWDERWTTAEANKILEGMGYTWKKSRAHVDAFAACLILKSYMEQ